MTKAHLFAFNISSDIVRNMNRKQYKAVSRWLRVCRNIVEARIDYTKLNKAINDAMFYGTGVYE